MDANLNSILDAALRFPVEKQQELVRKLLENKPTQKEKGKIRKHFGTLNGGNERSADNEQIDNDLARVYSENHEREN